MKQIKAFLVLVTIIMVLAGCRKEGVTEDNMEKYDLEYYSQKDIFLPLGSVVKVEDGTDFMIIGYCKNITNQGTHIFDYQGVYYPEGDLSDGQVYLFDKSDIKELKFVGYDTDESKTFIQSLVDEFNR